MWWKIYFWFDIFLVSIAIISLFGITEKNLPSQLFLIFSYCVALIGLYNYTFQKNIFSLRFWHYYFLLYVIIDGIYLIYAMFPPSIDNSYSYLSLLGQTSFAYTVIGTVLDIPLIYALYCVSQGKYNVITIKKKKMKKTRFQWGMIQMALWGYACILTFFLFLAAFIPTNGLPVSSQDATDSYYIVVMFAPLLFFWMLVLLQYKQYKWNWWKTTLVANAVLFSGSIIFGLFMPQSSENGSGFDLIGIIQISILLLAYYVFGKEQFHKSEKQIV